MNYVPLVQQEIADVRVARTWYGKLKLQIRRKVRSPKYIWNPNVEWVDKGLSDWKDANGNDTNEIAEIVNLLKRIRYD